MLGSDKFEIRQLFEKESCTYTYLVWDKLTLEAVLIDAVAETFSRDERIIKELGLKLKYLFETHVHADHITSVSRFLDSSDYDVKAVYSKASNLKQDGLVLLSDNDEIEVSKNLIFKFLSTPGHTDCSGCFLLNNYVFTGDTLFIRGCGRTDFQQGSSENLYDSVHNKIFSLDNKTVILPGHDYKGEMLSTVEEEKNHNPRLKTENTKAKFIEIMNSLNLAYPSKIDVALPANKKLGRV